MGPRYRVPAQPLDIVVWALTAAGLDYRGQLELEGWPGEGGGPGGAAALRGAAGERAVERAAAEVVFALEQSAVRRREEEPLLGEEDSDPWEG